jgi:hypothetical protein
MAAGLELTWCCGTTKLEKELIGLAGFHGIRAAEMTPVDIVLMDFVHRPSFQWIGVNCRAVITLSRSFRRTYIRPPSGITLCYHHVKHAAMGGVSSATIGFMVASSSSDLTDRVAKLSLPQYPTTTLGSILDCTIVDGKKAATIPSSTTGCVLGSGLFPLGCKEHHIVCAPCVQWPAFRLRALSSKEHADVLDIPSSFYLELTRRRKSTLVYC